MDKIVSSWLFMGISILLAATSIRILGQGVAAAREYNNKEMDSIAVSEAIREERVHLCYDNTTVYEQSIVSLILEHDPDRIIRVKVGATTYEWSSTTNSTDYKPSAINAVLPIDKLYNAQLIRSVDGYIVIGYYFEAVL